MSQSDLLKFSRAAASMCSWLSLMLIVSDRKHMCTANLKVINYHDITGKKSLLQMSGWICYNSNKALVFLLFLLYPPYIHSVATVFKYLTIFNQKWIHTPRILCHLVNSSVSGTVNNLKYVFWCISMPKLLCSARKDQLERPFLNLDK